MLPLHTHARVDGIEREHLLKVLSESEARSCDIPSENQAIWVDSIWPTGAPLPTAIISTKAIPDSRFLAGNLHSRSSKPSRCFLQAMSLGFDPIVP